MFSDERYLRLNFKWRGFIGFTFAGILALLIFYIHPETNRMLRYPAWLPIVFFALATVSYALSLLVIKSETVVHQKKMRIAHVHHALIFFILPILIKGLAYTYISGLWFFPTATFILLQIFYCRTPLIRIGSIFMPLIAYATHFVVWNTHYENKVIPIEILFTLFLMVVYWYLSTYFYEIAIQRNITTISEEKAEAFYVLYGLTNREQQIAGNVMDGHSAREIAERFDIAEGTVKNHIQNIYRKIGVNSRMNLLAKYINKAGEF